MLKAGIFHGLFIVHKKTGPEAGFDIDDNKNLVRRFRFVLLGTLEVVGQRVLLFIQLNGHLAAVNQ